MSAKPGSPVHAVVLAGGAGERFWPRSRAGHPKPLLRLFGGRSLLEATLDRARALAGDRVWVVCGDEHARAVRRASGLPPRRVLVEPRRRNTAMAVGLAATRIAAQEPEAALAVLSADHHIPDTRRFVADLRRAIRAACAEDALVVLGVPPTRPEVGYGYIRLARELPGPRGVHKVDRFVEKPDAARARRYLRSGRHLWNAGIFAWRARVILHEIETHAPSVHRALAPIRRLGGRARIPRDSLARAYRRSPSLPIDTAVLERSDAVRCLPARFAWSDVGTWESLAEAVGVAPGASHVLGGEAFFHEAPGNLVWGAPDRPVVLLGVEGLAVVDAGDALLVTRLDRSSELRAIVSHLRTRRRRDLL